MSRPRAFLAASSSVPGRVAFHRAEAAARAVSAGTARRPLFSGEELRGVVDVGDERLWM